MSRYSRMSVVALLCVLSLYAQNPTGRITGRVTDTSGAVIPGANVKSINLQTNVEAFIKTTSEGNFELLNLIPGQYRLEATMAGFKNYEQGPIELHVGDVLSIAVTMQLGTQAEKVTVTAEAPLLESSSAELGQVVTTKQLEDLPIPDSNALFMAMFAVNLTTTSPLENGYDPSGRSKTLNINAAGAMQNQNMLTLDGMPNMFGNTAAANIPTAEMVQEVKVSVAPVDASVGHFTGALINVVMKSGTNDFHGTLTYHHSDTSLNAVPYFTKVNLGTNPPETHDKLRALMPYILYNRFRGTFSGPVVFPKLYNGRNKTFFMVSADHYRLPYGGTGYYTVPTLKQRNGDFSDLLAVGSNYQIYDPFSAKLVNGRITRSPVAGNIIPPGQISPVAKTLLNYYPKPNLPGTVQGTNNLSGYPASTIDWSDLWTRIDHSFGPNHRFYASYNMYRCDALQNRYFGYIGGIAPTGVIQDNHHDAVTLDDVINLSPSWVLNTRYGIIRFSTRQPSPSAGFDLASLGMDPRLIAEIPKEMATLPSLSISGYTANGSGSGSKSYYTNQNLFVSAVHMRGNHSLKLGAELRIAQRTGYSFGNITPAYTFGTDWTKATDTAASSPIGQGLASFLYGLPTDGSKSNNASYATTSKMFAWYVHDDWKVTRKLTMNIGIRQELEFPTTERYNRTNRGFDFGTPNPVQGAAQANYARNPIAQIPANQFQVPGGLMFAGVGGNPSGIYGLQKANIMPRLGLVYQLDSRTVLRAGFGLYFESFAADYQNINQTGFSLATFMVPSVDNGLSFQVNLGNYPFPSGLLQPSGADGGLTTNLGSSVSFLNPAKHQGYAERWSFNIERQIGSRMLVQVGYTGNRGNHIDSASAWNSLPIQYLSRSPVRDQANINTLATIVPNPFNGIPQFARTSLATPTTTVSQLVLRFPQFTGVSSTDDAGFTWYHGFSARAERRFGNNFSLQANYTWSKMMEATSRMNGIQSPLEHCISSFDRPQMLSVNGVFELPFGKGRPLLNSMPGWANHIVGDWSLTALYLAQSGPPISFGNVLFTGDLHAIPLPRGERTVARWFNTDAGFNKNSPQQLAQNFRTFPLYLTGARHPGWNDWAISVIKRFRITERLKLELRGTGVNAFNHPWFGGPSTSPTSSTFGQITYAANRQIELNVQLQW